VSGAQDPQLAQLLETAWATRAPIEPPAESGVLSTIEEAYAVQAAWSRARVAAGDRVVGHKIGLTSQPMREQFGVDEPDFGAVWASRHFETVDGRAEVEASIFLQPRIEGEIAFLLGRTLDSPETTAEDVLAATEAVAAAYEIIDSRVADWRIGLLDTVADNASYGGYAVGDWTPYTRDRDLRTVGMLSSKNGSVVAEGVGAASLGDPAEAVAWLARTLAGFGTALDAGGIVLSGSVARAVPAAAGDTFVLEMHGERALTVAFV
jgi:2-keto-4-pentenoate hydratase